MIWLIAFKIMLKFQFEISLVLVCLVMGFGFGRLFLQKGFGEIIITQAVWWIRSGSESKITQNREKDKKLINMIDDIWYYLPWFSSSSYILMVPGLFSSFMAQLAQVKSYSLGATPLRAFTTCFFFFFRIDPCLLGISAFPDFNFLTFTTIGTHNILYHMIQNPVHQHSIAKILNREVLSFDQWSE